MGVGVPSPISATAAISDLAVDAQFSGATGHRSGTDPANQGVVNPKCKLILLARPMPPATIRILVWKHPSASALCAKIGASKTGL